MSTSFSSSRRASAPSPTPTSYLSYGDLKHLRWSLALIALAVGLYLWHEPEGAPGGGTWLGYGLGGVSAVLVLWLLWLGVEKRRFARVDRPLRAWVSAHVYLGLSLVVLVPLHAGFQFGVNVHSFAFAGVLAVVATGLIGVVLYALLPASMSRNRGSQKLSGLIQQVAEVDAQCKAVVGALPDPYARAVAVSIEQTRLGGSALRQLGLRADTTGADEGLRQVRKLSAGDTHNAEAGSQLIKLLARKQSLLDRVHRHLRYRALLELWLIAHVPLALATVTLVAIHVFVVFYYW